MEKREDGETERESKDRKVNKKENY